MLRDGSAADPSSSGSFAKEAEEGMLVAQPACVGVGTPAVIARLPSRKTVEPWSSLLLSGQAQEEEGLQDGQLAEAAGRFEGREEEQRAILQDVTRTRSSAAAFRDPEVRQWLQQSVSLFCRERGVRYAQGLTELAAPWALITDPPCLDGFSYRCFREFVDRFAPHIFETAPEEEDTAAAGGRRTFVVLEAHLVLLDHLLRFHDPTLAAHLDKCCVSPAAYATPWFVTLFARQTPVPALFHLWRRLVENGDPFLHQFLALALLVTNRRVLLGAPREDVPEKVARLRLPTAEVVDDVFGAAVALRGSTPRLFCAVLRRACYDGAEVAREAGAAGAAASPPSCTENWPVGTCGPASRGLATSVTRTKLLCHLRDTGVMLVDADQVAGILLGQHSPTAAAVASAAPESEEDRRSLGEARDRSVYILVDCRAAAEGVPRVLEAATDDTQVVWRRIDPAASGGREAAAVAEVLQPLGTAAGWEGDEEPGAAGAPLEPPVVDEISSKAVTHVCFIGSGRGNGGQGGSSADGEGHDPSLVFPVAAAVEGAAPEVRFARAASRSCLAAHACVLEGGFPALKKALLSRRRPESGGGAYGGEIVGDAGQSAASGRPAPGKTEPSEEGAAPVAARGGARQSAETSGGKSSPPSARTRPEPKGATANGLGGVESREPPVPLSLVSGPSQGLERKASRLAGKRRISEPFRVYAAKSADEMGEALRSLPMAASKPFEDAARVCNSLAKTNVRALGDSRLSLSRSITQLDELNARMDGTAGGFARYFGGGGLPRYRDVNNVDKR